jgi:hypothetical protein
LFFVLDNALFRNGFYTSLILPLTRSDKVARFDLREKHRAPSAKREVLLTGDSKMEFGFNQTMFDSENGNSPIQLRKAAMGGTNVKTWYYLLKDIDPNHDRYAAIVIPVRSFKVLPAHDDPENDFGTGQDLVPAVHVSDWPDFLSSFSNLSVRDRVRTQLYFSSHGTGIGFFVHGSQILTRIATGGKVKMLIQGGPVESVQSMVLSPDGRRIEAFPAHFDIFMQRESSMYFEQSPLEVTEKLTQENFDFQYRWLTRIIGMYGKSPTKIIFVRIPNSPFPLPAETPLPDAPDLRDRLPKARNVVYLSEDPYRLLYDRRYFYDLLHLNSSGGKVFTRQITTDVFQVLSGIQSSCRRDPPAEKRAPFGSRKVSGLNHNTTAAGEDGKREASSKAAVSPLAGHPKTHRSQVSISCDRVSWQYSICAVH